MIWHNLNHLKLNRDLEIILDIGGTVNAEIAVSLMTVMSVTLRTSEITVGLTLSANCFVCKANRVTAFTTIGTKLHIPVVNLSIQDYAKLL